MRDRKVKQEKCFKLSLNGFKFSSQLTWECKVKLNTIKIKFSSDVVWLNQAFNYTVAFCLNYTNLKNTILCQDRLDFHVRFSYSYTFKAVFIGIYVKIAPLILL